MLKINAVSLAVAIVGCGIVGQPAQAQQVLKSETCQGALSSLMSEWNAISFAAPSKPGQGYVSGRNGHVTSGGQFNYMQGQIRQAHAACERGDGASALQHISAVRDLLDRTAKPNG